ncbi:hypothetical protein AVEN_257807-1 [Araneus ventricosus]|uniref:Uncharacterized protein n=1 Tax=Araneus ventricosus TaxID=182803 RepID=A0A4Y2KG74_ARAVE|nr:hypothetical protein AVEN_257807-1 [Araneus ventricosus]
MSRRIYCTYRHEMEITAFVPSNPITPLLQDSSHEIWHTEFRADQVCGSMKERHLKCLAHFGDPPDGSIDVLESVYMYLYKEKIVREHLTGPQHYPDNGLVSGTRGEVSRNQEEEAR